MTIGLDPHVGVNRCLVGGLGPESTVDYYKRIIEVWQRHQPGSGPAVVIDSLDVQRAIRLVSGDHPALIAYLAASVQRLAAACAHFVAMTANTPHLGLRDQKGIDGVVLCGTELPQLLPHAAIAGVPALDTTALHVEAIVGRLREGERTA